MGAFTKTFGLVQRGLNLTSEPIIPNGIFVDPETGAYFVDSETDDYIGDPEV